MAQKPNITRIDFGQHPKIASMHVERDENGKATVHVSTNGKTTYSIPVYEHTKRGLGTTAHLLLWNATTKRGKQVKGPTDNTSATVAKFIEDRPLLAELSRQMNWNALKLLKIKAKGEVG